MSLWVEAISRFIGREVTVVKKNQSPAMTAIPTPVTLLAVDEECIHTSEIWPKPALDQGSSAAPGASRYEAVVQRSEIEAVVCKMEEPCGKSLQL